jgi:subtilisin family serine protease
MQRPGYVVFTLRPGEGLERVPAHLDYIAGAARPIARLDGGGELDQALRLHGDGFRAVAVFHARSSIGLPSRRHADYDALEEHLGMSRTYRARLADPAATPFVVDRLRSLSIVESATVQSLASAPFAVAVPAAAPTRHDAAAAHDMVRSGEALAAEPGDERVVVACVDTGVSLGHPELQRKLLGGYDVVDLGLGSIGRNLRLIGDSRGRDFSPLDDVGHGSHVAGIIGAQGWHTAAGVAGRALMLPVRVLAAARAPKARAPVGVGALPDIDAGMKVAVDLGAHVINMSFGTPAGELPAGAPAPHVQVVDYAKRYSCVLVAAAGNSGKPERFYPSALPGVVAVGSVDRAGRPSAFSTWGEHVALAAPGERIFGADRRGYSVASGTSFAAPFVAGAAALVLARARRTGRTLKPQDVRALLLASTRALATTTPNPHTGHGLLDVAAAIARVDTWEATA